MLRNNWPSSRESPPALRAFIGMCMRRAGLMQTEARSNAPLPVRPPCSAVKKIFGVTFGNRFRGVFRLPDAAKP